MGKGAYYEMGCESCSQEVGEFHLAIRMWMEGYGGENPTFKRFCPKRECLEEGIRLAANLDGWTEDKILCKVCHRQMPRARYVVRIGKRRGSLWGNNWYRYYCLDEYIVARNLARELGHDVEGEERTMTTQDEKEELWEELKEAIGQMTQPIFGLYVEERPEENNGREVLSLRTALMDPGTIAESAFEWRGKVEDGRDVKVLAISRWQRAPTAMYRSQVDLIAEGRSAGLRWLR